MKKKLKIYPGMFVFLRLLILLGIVALFLGCARVQVSQDYDQNFVFGKESSYAWNTKLQQEKDRQFQNDELLKNRFRKAIEAVLARKGFSLSISPNYLISYSYSVNKVLQVDPFDPYFDFGYYGYRRFGPYYGAGFDTGRSIRQYDQGKLVIEIHSAKTGHLVWKGTGTREVSTNSTPAEISQTVNDIVEAVLAQFPPGE